MRMRAWGFFTILAFAASTWGQFHYTVSKDGNPAGTAILTSKLTAKGDRLDEMSFRIRQVDKTNVERNIDLRLATSYRKDGSLLQKFMAVSLAGSNARVQIMVSFDAKGANVTVVAGGKAQKKSIPHPAGEVPREPDEFWFIRDQPKPGAHYKSTTFNVNTLQWVPIEVTYVGDEPITIEGRRFMAHKLQGSLAGSPQTAWEDSKGIPLRIVGSGQVIERTWKGKSDG